MSRTVLPRRLAAAGCVAATGLGLLVLGGAGSADAAAATMTITSINVHRLPALTDKQQIVVTGTNYAESSIKSVSLAGCTAVSYFVSNPTTLLVKTDDSCTTANNVALTIKPVSGSDVVSTPSTNTKHALAFVDAPTLAANDETTFPVVTAGTATQTAPTQTASVSGGTAIRVTAGSVKFVNSTTYPLSATFNGVKLTGISMKTSGDWFTGVLPASPANDAPVLTVTSNGVSKSFQYAAADSDDPVDDTFDFTIAGVGITATPASGPVDGGGTLTIKGTGFTASTTAKVGTGTCVKVSQTAIQFTCTIPKATSAGPVTVETTTGAVKSVVTAGSTYTYVP